MTARLERLTLADQIILIVLLSVLSIFLFPAQSDASVVNKQTVLEIKSSEPISLPDYHQIDEFMYGKGESTKTEPVTLQVITVTPVPVIPPPAPAKVTAVKAVAIGHSIPPKAVNKVYMHEPELIAYLCPRMGNDKCKIFIAILKAENGTHECTRDNRGTNRNGSIDIGLTQINWTPSSPYSFEQLQDCLFNLEIALKKYEARGFQPWYAYTKGTYIRHLAYINIP
jgi:hypothetical protein